MSGLGRIPGVLGASLTGGRSARTLNSLVTTQAIQLAQLRGVGKGVGKQVVKQIGKRLTALALRKAASRIVGKMATNSRFWVKAFEHIALHFSEDALASKAVHAVFLKKFCSKAAVEDLIRQGASKAGRRTLSKATFGGVPIGTPVVVLEREFSQVIGHELTKAAGGAVTRVECKILRIIVDFTGRPITAFPVSKFL